MNKNLDDHVSAFSLDLLIVILITKPTYQAYVWGIKSIGWAEKTNRTSWFWSDQYGPWIGVMGQAGLSNLQENFSLPFPGFFHPRPTKIYDYF